MKDERVNTEKGRKKLGRSLRKTSVNLEEIPTNSGKIEATGKEIFKKGKQKKKESKPYKVKCKQTSKINTKKYPLNLLVKNQY